MRVKVWYPPDGVISLCDPENQEKDIKYLQPAEAEKVIALGYLRNQPFYPPGLLLVPFLSLDYPTKMRVTVNGKRVPNAEAVERMVWAFQETLKSLVILERVEGGPLP